MSSFVRVEAFGSQLEDAEVQFYLNRDGEKKQDKFYASGVMDCGRKQVNEILKEYPANDSTEIKEGFNVQYRRAAALGDIIHGLLQSWAVATGKVKRVPAFTRDHKPLPPELVGTKMDAIEVPVNRFTIPSDRLKEWAEHKMGGKCDGIITTGGGIDYIWEIKTVDTKYLTQDSHKKWMVDKLAHYEAQVQWYMWAFNIQQGIITVIDRDKFMEWFQGIVHWPWSKICYDYSVVYDPMFMAGELDRVARLAEDLEKKELPAGEPGRGPCRFCSERTCVFNPKRGS